MVERLSNAKVILLATNTVIKSHGTKQLRSLIAQYPSTLRTDLVLRILLTYLPETADVSEYLPILEDLATGSAITTHTAYIDTEFVKDLEEKEALKQVRSLHLESLLWSGASQDVPADAIIQFLIHRVYNIDHETGLSAQLQELITPFLDRSPYLRTWMISTLLPITRFRNEYYPQIEINQTIATFEQLSDHQGVKLLLSGLVGDLKKQPEPGQDIARDLRMLVGPYMYDGNGRKRRKLRSAPSQDDKIVQASQPLHEHENNVSDWHFVFELILRQASVSWRTCIEAINKWEGPMDIDLGGYACADSGLKEPEQQQLQQHYARLKLAIAYTVPVASSEALNGIYSMLSKVAALLDLVPLTSLEADTKSLPTIQTFGVNYQLLEHVAFVSTDLLNNNNILTTPNQASLEFLHGLILSTFILARFGIAYTVRKAGQLVLLQDEHDQHALLNSILAKIATGPKGDDKYWIHCRHEILWLHNWGRRINSDDQETYSGGLLGAIRKDYIEIEMLKLFLANTRYTLSKETYEDTDEPQLSRRQLQSAVVTSALHAYDGSSNANRTRGGIKKCNEIIAALPLTMDGTEAELRIRALIKVTHSIGRYRLVLRQDEPFLPIHIRTHKDPVALLEKILEQNPGSYTQIQEFVDMAETMIEAGLTIHDIEATVGGNNVSVVEEKKIASKRVQAFCIDAALAEDDFETAYSFTMTKLEVHNADADSTSTSSSSTLTDDFSWRAALQTGKYRMNSRTTKPTHVGNASGNLEIRHLEQRMECISLALRIAPRSTLQEILNVARRCEEELEIKLKEEVEAEAEWDRHADQNAMPGGFGADTKPATLSRHGAERNLLIDGPVSIFDLTKASAAKAQQTFSAMSGLKLGSERTQQASQPQTSQESIRTSGEYVGGVFRPGARKRDQLRDVAVGTLASGVGWLIGASSTARPHSPTTHDVAKS